MFQKKSIAVVAIALSIAAVSSTDVQAQLFPRRRAINSSPAGAAQRATRRQVAGGILGNVAAGMRSDSHGGNSFNTAKVLNGIGNTLADSARRGSYKSAFPYQPLVVQATAHEPIRPRHTAIADVVGSGSHEHPEGMHPKHPSRRPIYGSSSYGSSFLGKAGYYGNGYEGGYGLLTRGSKSSCGKSSGVCRNDFSSSLGGNDGFEDRFVGLSPGSCKFCSKKSSSYNPGVNRCTCKKPVTTCVPLSAIGCLTKFDCDRRMQTSAKIDRKGILHVDIEMRTEPGAGFQAAAIVGILDREGNLIWARKTPNYRVSGNPYTDNDGLSLERHWDKKIPSRLFPHIEAIVIVNSTRPTSLLRALLDNREDRMFVEEILEENGAEVFWREKTMVDTDW